MAFPGRRTNNQLQLGKLLKIELHDLQLWTYNCGTPLHTAIIHGHLDVVKLLLFPDADPYALAPDIFGYPRDSALSLAARQGQRGIAWELWTRNGEEAIQKARASGETDTALELASMFRFGDLVKDLLSWYKWDRKTQERALLLTARRWAPDAVQALVETARFEQRTLDDALLSASSMKLLLGENGYKMMYNEAEYINYERTINVFEAGASPNSRSPDISWDANAIHIAAQKGETTRGLKALLQRGADVHVLCTDK
ncbi:hypothetical protein AJ79_08335 [Helicocarpus griseus UAMH5409]|uniref:Uncharacterized protein n=1 Tax=Helicocarpus griseus UAMH5409 TaxID=1447875 RepID=A0A2B7WL14_9EURO|nr:hypothetical protein AJ79_08335 [Helicocarpus griseus UAMH5409]